MISVLGSINLDQIAAVSRLPAAGETLLSQSFTTAPGGKGANQALAARRAGARVRFIGAVGRDAFADPALALLKTSGVDLSSLRTVEGSTGVALILTDTAGENLIVVASGANAQLDLHDADAALTGLGPSDHLLLQQEIPAAVIDRALDRAKAAGVNTILNTAPFIAATPTLAHKAAFIIANEGEFAELSGGSAGQDAMLSWAKAHGTTLIVTLGGAGACAATSDQFLRVPALDILAVDTVGAGDTFCGYFAAGLDAGLALEPALRRAAIASLACLERGAQNAIPHAAQVAEMEARK